MAMEGLGKFSAKGMMGGAGNFIGSMGTLLGGTGDMEADERGAAIGGAIGGGVGMAVNAFVPIPGLGEAIGQVGTIVGGLAGKAKARKDAAAEAAASASRTYGAFHEQANVNPYGEGNSAYMAEDGMGNMGLSMFMLNTKLPVKAKVNPLDTKLMTDHGHVPGVAPQSDMGSELEAFAQGGFIKGGRLSAFAKARNMDVNTVANKILKKRSTAKWMAAGGFIGGEDPKKPPYNPNVYNSQEEINAANEQARGIMGRRINWDDPTQAYLANNAVVARKVGDPKVPFVYPQGRPDNVQNLPTRLPPGITIDQVENTSEGYGYWHPQSGNFMKVDPAVYGTSKQPQPQTLAKFAPGGMTEDPPTKEQLAQMFPLKTDYKPFGGAMAMSTAVKPTPIVAEALKEKPKNLITQKQLESRKQQRILAKQAEEKEYEQAKEIMPYSDITEPIINGLTLGRVGKAPIRNRLPFTFPNGESKTWDDMDWREREYVRGRRMGAVKTGNWTDYVNPGVAFGESAEGARIAPYMARETDSYMPYVTGYGLPIATLVGGELAGPVVGRAVSKALNPVVKAVTPALRSKVIDPVTKMVKAGFKSDPSIVRNDILGGLRTTAKTAAGTEVPVQPVVEEVQQVIDNTAAAEAKAAARQAYLEPVDREMLQRLRAVEREFKKGTGIPVDADPKNPLKQLNHFRNLAVKARTVPESYFRKITGKTPAQVEQTVNHLETKLNEPLTAYEKGYKAPIEIPESHIPENVYGEMDDAELRDIENRAWSGNYGRSSHPNARINEALMARDKAHGVLATMSPDELSRVNPAVLDLIRYNANLDLNATNMLRLQRGESISDIFPRARTVSRGGIRVRPSNTQQAHRIPTGPDYMTETNRSPMSKELVSFLETTGVEDPSRVFRKAYKEVESGKTGDIFHPSGSLSTDSAPMSLGLAIRALKDKLVDVNFHGFGDVNGMGVLSKADMPNDLSVKELNGLIDELNLNLTKKIPYAHLSPFGRARYPRISVTRLEDGGMVSGDLLSDHFKSLKHGGMNQYEMGGLVPQDYYAAGGYIDDDVEAYKKGGWIKKAVNPKHKGYCTPMTKATCTPRRKALARTFKKHHGFHKAEDGMMLPNEEGTFEEQGMEQQPAPEAAQQQPKSSVVNIELGELVVDPNTGEIIKEFTNKSRYSKHSDNPMKEPSGNFVTLPTQVVVIPKKLAKGYKEGNKLTQSSMLRQILKDQMDRAATGEQEMTPMPAGEAPMAAYGMLTEFDDPNNVDPPKPKPFFDLNNPAVTNALGNAAAMNNSGLGAIPGLKAHVAAIQNAKTSGVGVGPGQKTGFMRTGIGINNPPELDVERDVYDDDPSALGLIQGLQFIPAGLQLLESFKGNPDLRMHTNAGFNEARRYANQMPTDVNYDAAKREVGVAGTTRNRALMNFRRPDVAGEMATAYGEGLDRVGEIEMNEYNQEEQLKMGKLKALGDVAIGQGQDFQTAQREMDLAKEQDAAARRTMRHSAVSESVSRVAKNYMDMEKIKAGNQMTDLFETNPYLRSMIQDKPGGIDFMVNYLNTQYPGMNITPDVVTSMMNETSTTVNPMTGMPRSRTNRTRVYRKPGTKKNTR